MNTVHESGRTILIPVAIPADPAEADVIEKEYATAMGAHLAGGNGGRVFKGKRRVGLIVGKACWPYAVTLPVTSGDGSVRKATTLPARTQYLSLELEDWALAEHRAGGLALDECHIRPPAKRDALRKYAPNIYSGGDSEPKPGLENPDDGAPLSAYGPGSGDTNPAGVPYVGDEPPAGQAEAVAHSFATLGAKAFHQHARAVHPRALHALVAAVHGQVPDHVHAHLLAAAADYRHPDAEAVHPETRADAYGGLGQHAAQSVAVLDPRGTGASGAGATRNVATAEPAREGIDLLSPNMAHDGTWRYATPHPSKVSASRAADLAVSAQVPPAARRAYRRRSQGR